MSTQELNASPAPADTRSQPEPLSQAEAIAQVQQWIDAGLPGPKHVVLAFASPKHPPGTVNVNVESREAVDMWVAALGIPAVTVDDAPDDKDGPLYHTGRCLPVALAGWRLDVWTWLPNLRKPEPPFQIEVMQAAGHSAVKQHDQYTRPWRAQLEVVEQVPSEGTTYFRIPSRDNDAERVGFTQGCGGDFPAWLEELPVGTRIYAMVNVGAVRDTDLVFTDWERPS